MDYKIVTFAPFTVIGIEFRTDNTDIAQKMKEYWTTFMSQGVYNKIPPKIDNFIIGLYTDYESDSNGKYTFILGCRMPENASVPEGLVKKIVPGGKYAFFTVTGKFPEMIQETWKEIHEAEKRGEFVRTYTADLETYDERYANGELMEIYVAIK
jgi:predicted transcriptional regulator YdeE